MEISNLDLSLKLLIVRRNYLAESIGCQEEKLTGLLCS
jgi:hypothetical protein